MDNRVIRGYKGLLLEPLLFEKVELRVEMEITSNSCFSDNEQNAGTEHLLAIYIALNGLCDIGWTVLYLLHGEKFTKPNFRSMGTHINIK